MSKIQATNNFIFIIRDAAQDETLGLIIPGSAREKPHQGTIYSVGELTKDKKIKVGKKGVFHAGIGFEIEIDGQVYLVLTDSELIGIL